jgi:NADPH2:quinone reductase
VQELGADVVLNRSKGDYWAELADLTNKRGVDVIVESVGAATWGNYFNHLVNGGRLVTYGNTSRGTAETELSPIYWNQRQIIGTTMSNRKEFAEVMQLIFERKLHPVIDKIFPLEQASAAYKRIDKGEQFGKVVLKIGD